MKCSRCGAEVFEGAAFCTKCGAQVVEEPVEGMMVPVQALAAGGDGATASAGKSSTPLIVAVGVAAAAVAFAAAMFLAHGATASATTADTGSQAVAATTDAGASKDGSNITIVVPERASAGTTYVQAPTAASASSGYSGGSYVIPYSSSSYLSTSDLSGLSCWQLRLARNEIYARHGRGFKDSSLQSYFNGQSWYTRCYDPDSFPESLLSSVEQHNAKFILSYEKSIGSPYV